MCMFVYIQLVCLLTCIYNHTYIRMIARIYCDVGMFSSLLVCWYVCLYRTILTADDRQLQNLFNSSIAFVLQTAAYTLKYQI